jgi:hypothetical protein
LLEKVICCSCVISSIRRHRGVRIYKRVPVVFWALSFALQLAFIPIAVDGSSQWLGKLLRETALPYSWLDFSVAVTRTLLPDFIGFLLGFALKPAPAWIREPGRWIFVVPAVIYPALLIAAYFGNLHDLLFLVYGKRGVQYEGLDIIELIFSFGGVCLYSIGIRAGDRHSNPLANVFGDEDVIPEDDPRFAATKKSEETPVGDGGPDGPAK